MPKRKTTKEFKKEVEYLTGGEFEFTGEYINKNKKAEFLHKKCNNKFMIAPTIFLNDCRCLICNETVNFNKVFDISNKEEFKEEFDKRYEGKYELLSDFVDFNTKVKVLHKLCKQEREILPHKIFLDIKCSICQGGIEKPKLSIEEELYKKYWYEYVLLEEISKKAVYLLHTKCKKKFKYDKKKIYDSSIICPKCKEPYYNTNTFKLKIDRYTKGEFQVVSKYIGFDDEIKIKHTMCNQTFSTTPNVFLKTPKCSICERDFSLGEKVVNDTLLNNNVCFKREYRFEDCKNKYTLAFDFAIFNKEYSELLCLLEYDGEHHYIPVAKFGGMKKLIENKKKDEIKNEYCKKNNIKLIRIPFWEFENIEKIIKKEVLSL